MIRSSENKPTKLEANQRFRLWHLRLRSSENCIVGVASLSRRQRINQSQCSIPGVAICWFFRFCFRLRQCSFHWIICDRVINGIRVNEIGRNRFVLILPTPIPHFDFHQVISDLITPSTTPIPSLVKTSCIYSTLYFVI